MVGDARRFASVNTCGLLELRDDPEVVGGSKYLEPIRRNGHRWRGVRADGYSTQVN
jgi:hypothetical protein